MSVDIVSLSSLCIEIRGCLVLAPGRCLFLYTRHQGIPDSMVPLLACFLGSVTLTCNGFWINSQV